MINGRTLGEYYSRTIRGVNLKDSSSVGRLMDKLRRKLVDTVDGSPKETKLAYAVGRLSREAT